MKEKLKKTNMTPSEARDMFETSQIFMFSRKTKLSDLKTEVCQFWDLNPDEFELYEKSHILLMRYDESVELYFFTTIDAQRAEPELIIQMPDRQNIIEFNEENEGEAAGQKKPKKEENTQIVSEKMKKRLERKKKAAHIEMKYPGMQKYSFDGKAFQEKDFGIDNHISAFVVLLIMLVFSCVIITQRNAIHNQYYMGNNIENALRSPPIDSLHDFMKFSQVSTPEHVYTFLRKTFLKQVIDSGSELRKWCTFVGSVRMRQLRVNTKECPDRSPKNSICYEKDYSSGNKSIFFHNSLFNIDKTDFISQFINITYQSPSSANQSYSFDGDIGRYDGGGLMIDWLPNTTYAQFERDFINLENSNFFSPATRAFIIEWTFYNPSTNLFSYCRIVFFLHYIIF